MTPSKPSAKTGNAYTDGILAGVQWDAREITWGIPGATTDYRATVTDYARIRKDGDNNYTVNELLGFSAVSAGVAKAASDAMAAVANLTNLGTRQVTTNIADATLRLGQSDAVAVANVDTWLRANLPNPAYANYPDMDRAGDIWFRTGRFDTAHFGTYEYITTWHEIGHALGLKHPHDSDPTLPLDRDGYEFTIMSYRSVTGAASVGYTGWNEHMPQSLMMLDIAALQHLYGADYGFNAGNTVYSFDNKTGQMFLNGIGDQVPQNAYSGAVRHSNVLFRTIWDGGGTDTYDFSNFTKKLSIDLRPGLWSDLDVGGGTLKAVTATGALISDVKYAKGHVYNALPYNGSGQSLIENAKGGSNDDYIYGNWGNNQLFGGDGNDILQGFEGVDNYDGGNGFDTVNFDGVFGSLTVLLGVGGYAIADFIESLTSIEAAIGSLFGDTMRGDDQRNVFWGRGNSDRIYGNGGDDDLYGETGDDTLDGGPGADLLDGGTGAYDLAVYADSPAAVTLDLELGKALGGWANGDKLVSIESLRGSSFDDVLRGDSKINVIWGDAGNDTVWGRDGNDTLYGGSGDDVLEGGGGADLLFGDGGFDTATHTGPAPVTLNLTTGVHSGEAAGDRFFSIEAFSGTAAADVFVGDAVGQLFIGNAGDDTLYGLGGTDTLRGGVGADWLDGGGGFDMASYLDAPSSITADLSLPMANGGQGKVTGGDFGDTLISIEDLQGSTFADTLLGTAISNKFLGAAGNDTLDGRAGGDILYGETGDDVINGYANDFWLDGGIGFDTLRVQGTTSFLNFANATFIVDSGYLTNVLGFEAVVGTSGLDWMAAANGIVVLYGMGGSDTLMASAVGATLAGGAGADNLIGGVGFDTLDYGGDTAGVQVDLRSGIYRGGEAQGDTSSGIEGIAGGAGNDRLGGTDARNILTGRAGHDYLAGYAGDDTISGDAGNDSVDGGLGADQIDGGDGNDLLADAEQAVLKSRLRDGAADIMRGGAGNDTLMSSGGADLLDGGEGTDLLFFAQAPAQEIRFTASLIADWTINQGNGVVATVRSVERFDMTGGSGADQMNAAATKLGVVLRGGAGGDMLVGGAGNDVLYGGTGNNRLTGGQGSDRFVFDTPPAATTRIMDFATGIDRIEIARGALGAPTELVVGSLATQASRFAANTPGTATQAGAQFVYETDSRVLWWDADGTGAVARQMVASLSSGTMTAMDVWIV